MALLNTGLDAKVNKPVENTYAGFNTIQAMPNYPPYSLPLISELSGRVIFAGGIPHAISASAFAQDVFACDLDQVVIGLYSEVIETMLKTPSRQRFAELFNQQMETVLTSKAAEGRSVALSPQAYLPFLNHDDFYDAVRENVGKVKIVHGNIVDLLKELKSEGVAASVIDYNNVPEYIRDWSLLFKEPPLQKGGVIFFGKRDKTVYEMPDGTIHPGVLQKGLIGNDSYAPKDGRAVEVLDALRKFGFSPFTAETIFTAQVTECGVTYDMQKATGSALIRTFEQEFITPKLRKGAIQAHNLFIAQYTK